MGEGHMASTVVSGSSAPSWSTAWYCSMRTCVAPGRVLAEFLVLAVVWALGLGSWRLGVSLLDEIILLLRRCVSC